MIAEIAFLDDLHRGVALTVVVDGELGDNVGARVSAILRQPVVILVLIS